MNLTIVTISVNYLDILQISYLYNKTLIDSNKYHIITSESDSATLKFCKDNYINCWTTDAFYINNSKFNKGAALNAIFDGFHQTKLLDSLEWILLLDSDIIISECLDQIKTSFDLNKIQNICNGKILENESYKYIYGCPRRIYNTEEKFLKGDFWLENTTDLIGYFQLFHISSIINDIRKEKPIFYEHYDASSYDDKFRDRWPRKYRRILNVYCDHLGPIAKNWKGRVTPQWSIHNHIQ